jgi:hypothetical protein
MNTGTETLLKFNFVETRLAHQGPEIIFGTSKPALTFDERYDLPPLSCIVLQFPPSLLLTMISIYTTGSSLILSLLLLPRSSSASLQDAFAQRFLQPNQQGPNFVNDLFHCLGVVQEDDDTVNCDMVTSLWNVSSLDPNEMPNSCVGVNITEDFLTVANDDFVEPCIWWHLLYGSLSAFSPSAMPSAMPSPVPSKLSECYRCALLLFASLAKEHWLITPRSTAIERSVPSSLLYSVSIVFNCTYI